MPVQEGIHAFLLDRYQLWQTHGDLLKIVFAEALFDRELAEGFCAKITCPAPDVVEAYLARGIREGVLRDLDPRIAARALVGHVFAPTLLYDAMVCQPERPLSAEAYATALTDLFLNGTRR